MSPPELQSLLAGHPPPWACAWGQDHYGVFASVGVGEVEQRMRWIPPGRFWMGSPETEEGRWDNEGPRHIVTLLDCYWLADTPCTQEMWEAVMGSGSNTSKFRSPRRPVENVSWKLSQDFIARLNELIPGLKAFLPSEAQWEYACRAGTGMATWLGDLEIEGDRNAPLLDSIAWYGGNSGVGFELDQGRDTSNWQGKQYSHSKAGTRVVASKHSNPWGLYDMLGNVFEWCNDWFSDRYEAEPAVNPGGPKEGPGRVFRGGSWDSYARSVRAAYRSWYHPDNRSPYLGFRFARGQGRGADREQQLRGLPFA